MDQTYFRRTKAYSYIRFSTPAQAFGDSARRQLEATRKYCAEHNLELDEELRDEGLSGYKGIHRKKGALGRFLNRVQAGEIERGSRLIVEAFDRLSRQTPREALQQFLDIINAGIVIVTLIDQQRFDAASVDANIGQLFLSIGMMFGAHSDSKNKASRVKASWVPRRSRLTRMTPTWIRISADGADYEVIPQCRIILERIFTECRDGIGLDRIAKRLNQDGVPCFSSRKRTSAGWYDSYLRKIITGREVLGYVQIGEYKDDVRVLTDEVRKVYPAAVSQELWDAANAALLGRRGTGGKHIGQMVNLFSGYALCGACGGRMHAQRKGNRNDHTYVRCRAAKRGLCENTRYHNYRRIEKTVLDTFASLAIHADDETTQRNAISDRITVARRELADLEKAYAAQETRARENPGPLADRRLAVIEQEYNDKTNEVTKLEKELRGLSAVSKDQHVAEINAMIARMDTLESTARDELRAKLNADLRRIINSIQFQADGSVQILLFSATPATADRSVQIIEPPADAIRLTTADEVLQAVAAGHLVGMSPGPAG
jgi:DNA invertase Pin-like site-specific DNA recombinase